MSMARYAAGAMLVASLGVGVGCGRVAHFTVVRPAMLNAAAAGNSMAVGPVQDNGYGMAAQDIASDLQNRIAHSLNPSITLVPAGPGAGVVIGVNIQADDYNEQIQRNVHTCSRQVAAGTNAQGVVQYRTENYNCTDISRVGTGISRVLFTITAGATGQPLFSNVYELSDRAVTMGRESPYESNPPAPIDSGGLLHNIRATNTARFARVILPWQEVVSVHFADCDGDPRCRQGFDLVQQGQLATAEGLFTQVIGAHQSAAVPVIRADAERVGEAFYNRGVTREYLGNYAPAAADLLRAIAIRPNETDWPQELTSVQRMQADQERLRQQGAIHNDQQNVQSAGTP